MFRESQKIGVYTLIRKLGQGGFGEVWLAENRSHSPSEKVAIKLPRTNQIDLQAVKDEIFNWILSGRHKNILPIIECETFGNQIAIVSEYAPDGSLQNLINKKDSLPISDAIEITIGILDGLAHLHNRQIIHRDLKPDNVLFQGNVPRLTDFGISRAMTVSSQSQTVSGTLSYMAPEAFDGKRNTQTDIWAVGVILYQLLTGNLPFPQKEMIEFVGALARQEPAPLPASIPSDLRIIVKKSLEKELPDRYKTAAEMAKKLHEFSQKKSEETLKIPSYEVSPTEPSRIIVEPVTDKSNSVITDVKVPSEIKEAEKSIRPVSSQTKPKTNPLYLAVPAVILFFLAIVGGSYWLTNNNSSSDQVFIPFRKGDKFGFSNVNKKILIEPKYDKVQPFKEGYSLVVLNNRLNVIDKTGNQIVPVEKYDFIFPSTENLLIVGKGANTHNLEELQKNPDLQKKVKLGVLDKNGRESIVPKYDFKDIFSMGLDFEDGVAVARLNGKYGFIDNTGKELSPFIYDDVTGIGLFSTKETFKEGLARVTLNGKVGFVDKTGKEIIPPRYDSDNIYMGDDSEAVSFNEGLARVKLNNKYGFIDKVGNEVIPLIYENVSRFQDGLASVKLDDKWGFINQTGVAVISIEYDEVSSAEDRIFSDGLALIKLNNKYGFINKTGKKVISLIYDEAESFQEGIAKVRLNDKTIYIDKTGKEIFTLSYKYFDDFSEGLMRVGIDDNKKSGFIDKTGKVIIPIKYESAESFSDGFAFVKLNGKEFYIDKNGTEYYEP